MWFKVYTEAIVREQLQIVAIGCVLGFFVASGLVKNIHHCHRLFTAVRFAHQRLRFFVFLY